LYSDAQWLKSDGIKAEIVSIVIPVYGQLIHTACCLLSILEERRRNYRKDQVSIEIIVVDDCSPNTEETNCLRGLSQEGLIKLVSKKINSGFIDSCNAGAEAATGRVIVFLNNDVEVLDHWIEELVAPLANSNVGLVGSKLLYPDGSLQEAGGIIWSNGNAWNYGRGTADPYLPEFTYVRSVDYISGASIAVRKKDFLEVGGFSGEFRPAYCEDSDLALKIRHRLKKDVIFNPFSQIVHYEGKSCGSDLETGTKRYQVVNSKKLFRKWETTLVQYQHEDGTDIFHARGRSSAQVTVLIIDHYIPEPNRDAGSRTIDAFIQTLKRLNCRIVFWPDNLYASQYCKRLQKLGVEVIYFTQSRCPSFEEWLGENSKYIDLALISRPTQMLKYAPVLNEYVDCPIIYYGHDLHHRRVIAEHSTKGVIDNHKELEELRKEKDAWSLASLILYPTSEEVNSVREHLGPMANVQSIQAFTCTSIDEPRKIRDFEISRLPHYRLLFVGGFRHAPNVDAMVWFCKSVLPIISAKVECKLTIAGSNPCSDVLSLEGKGVKVRGFVTDEELEELYLYSDIAVVPLRYGAGIKGKVIEAFSKGIPVATTSIGLQGISWSERLAYVGDSAEEFANAVLEAMKDISTHTDRSAAITRSALSFVKAKYSVDSMDNAWRELLNRQLPSTKIGANNDLRKRCLRPI